MYTFKKILLISALLTQHTIAQAKDVNFPAEFKQGDTTLTLQNVGLVRYKKIFKVYNAALYTASRDTLNKILDDVPKRLELAYLRPITKDVFVDIGNKTLRELLDASQLKQLEEQLDQINAAYEDVKAGDRYAPTYIPEKGTELSLNGEPKALIEGSDFAAAYFRIWLDPNGAVPDLCKKLLDTP